MRTKPYNDHDIRIKGSIHLCVLFTPQIISYLSHYPLFSSTIRTINFITMPSCSYPSFSGTYPLITASLILPSIIVIFAFILALLYCSTKSQSPYANLPLPPGPRGNFLTGVDLAAYMRNSEFREPWKLYAEWGRVYGGQFNYSQLIFVYFP